MTITNLDRYRQAESRIAAGEADRAAALAGMFFEDHLTQRQISVAIGVSESTVRSWLHEDPRYATVARRGPRRRPLPSSTS